MGRDSYMRDSDMSQEEKKAEDEEMADANSPLFNSQWDFSKLISKNEDSAIASKIMKKAKYEFGFITTVKKDKTARPHCHACFQTQKPVECVAT